MQKTQQTGWWASLREAMRRRRESRHDALHGRIVAGRLRATGARAGTLALALVLAGAGAACSDSTEPVPAAARPASLIPLTPTNLAGPVGTAFAPAPTVRVRDQAGRPMPGVEVVFEFFDEAAVSPIRSASVFTDPWAHAPAASRAARAAAISQEIS